MIEEKRHSVENESTHYVCFSGATEQNLECCVEAAYFQRINQLDPGLGHCEDNFYRQSDEKTEAKVNDLSKLDKKIPKRKLFFSHTGATLGDSAMPREHISEKNRLRTGRCYNYGFW